MEDTDTTLVEIEERFGAAVRSVVEEVTDDKALPQAERKRLQVERAAGRSPRARLVALADKLHNLRDINRCTPQGSAAPGPAPCAVLRDRTAPGPWPGGGGGGAFTVSEGAREGSGTAASVLGRGRAGAQPVPAGLQLCGRGPLPARRPRLRAAPAAARVADPARPRRVVVGARAGVLPVGVAGGGRSARDKLGAGGRAAAALRGARPGPGAAGARHRDRDRRGGPGTAGGARRPINVRIIERPASCVAMALGASGAGSAAGFRRGTAAAFGRSGLGAAPRRPAMAFAGRRDVPEPPDFGILKRLARDQLIYLLEQVRHTAASGGHQPGRERGGCRGRARPGRAAGAEGSRTGAGGWRGGGIGVIPA